MMTIIAEQPLMLAIMSGIIAIGLGYAWLQTGDKRLAAAAFLVALLVPGSFIIASRLVTDREMIREAVFETAKAVEQNDFESAVLVIEDRALRQRALSELPNYDFQRVGVRNVQIRMVKGSYPPEATVDLDASVTATLVRAGMQTVRVPRRVIITFQQQSDGQWIVTDYTHRPLAGGPDAFTPNRL